MTKEYLFTGAHRNSLQHRLNEFAKDGWILVSVLPCIQADHVEFVMTRTATGAPIPREATLGQVVRDMHTEHDPQPECEEV